MVDDSLSIDTNIDGSNTLKTNLERSCSEFFNLPTTEQQQQLHSDQLAAVFSVKLAANSAEHLNWKFLEHVSTLDNQLRNDHQACGILAADDTLMTNAFNDADNVNIVEHQETIKRKANGYAINGNICNDIFSQQADVLVSQQQQQQQQQQIAANPEPAFEFSSPTSTFKRKKQQAELNNSSNSNNNNNSRNNKNIIEQPATTQQQQQQQHAITIAALTINRKSCQHGNAELFATKTMLSGTATINIDTVNATNTHTHPHPHTLPQLADERLQVDVLSHTNAAGIQHKAKKHKQKHTHAHRQHTQMGATMQSSGSSGKANSFDDLETHLGVIGWRKKCLYTLLMLLMLLIITNFMLTLWILQVMEFTTDGMGQLKIVPGGIQLSGQALIMDVLKASTIRSRHGQPIAIESSRNFSINTRDTNGMLENHLFLGHDKLECLASGFRINDTAGRNLFSVNRNEVTIGAHALRIDGEGGAIFRESIQTPHVRAEPGRELRLESPTRQLEMTAAKDINLQSRAGGIEISALSDVKLSALDGSLRLESTKILMPNLRTAQPPLPGAAQNREHSHRVFQLCACSNGKLFLAAAHSICAGDDSTVCR